MRGRWMIALVLVSAGLLAPPAAVWAGGGGASANGGAQLTVHNVFGLETLELQTFGFNARTNADGTASGWYTYRELDDGVPFTADGPVTCLTVIGRDAWIGGVIVSSSDPTVVGDGSWWHVTDNGQGAGAAADITTFLGIGSTADTQAFCDSHPAYKHPFAIDSGNIQVRDS